MLAGKLSRTLVTLAAAVCALTGAGGFVAPASQAEAAPALSSAVIYSFYPSIGSSAGNLNGITSQLTRVKKLGATIVWLMPVTPIGEPIPGHGAFGSPYCVHNYYAVSSDYGTPADLKRLVRTAHSMGLKVILDEVLNHTSWDNALITKHPQFYVHTDGNIDNPSSIAQAFNYSDVAQLDYKNHDLWTYMDHMLAYWLRTYDIDGFRFDSASNPGGSHRMIDAGFWAQAGEYMKAVKPNIILLGECEDPDLALKPFALDYGWNVYYSFKDAEAAGNTQAVIDAVHKQTDNYPHGMLHMSLLEDWDIPVSDVALGSEQAAMGVATFNFTTSGVPMIYNGMEIGNQYANTNPHTPIAWDNVNPGIAKFFKHLIALRAQNLALYEGRFDWIANSTPSQVLSYARSQGQSKFIVLINLSGSSVNGTIVSKDSASYKPVWPEGMSAASVKIDPMHYELQPKGFAVYERE